MFENHQIDIKTLPNVSDIQYKKLEPKYRTLSLTITAVIFLAILIVYLFIGYFVEELYEIFWLSLFFCVWIILGGLFMLLVDKSYDFAGFAIRSQDISYKEGIIFRSQIVVPFNRVQHCEINHGPIDRLFGLCGLSIFTAGGSSSDLSIDGLDEPTALKLKEIITQKVTTSDEEE